MALHPLSQAGVFIYSFHGKWHVPPLLWSFPPTATFTSFPTPGCWACAAAPAFSSRLVYLQFCEGFPLPPLRCSGHPALFAMWLFCCYCLLFTLFFSFFPGWGRSVQGAMLSWPRVVCGSTMYCLAHLWSASPKLVRSWLLAPREPSWCLHLTWSVDALRWLGVWRCRSFTSSWWLFLQGVSTASLQDFTLGSMLSASSL
jgi:hypothetical protein